MKYTKSPLTIEEQVDLMLQRGMIGDRDEMVRQLTVVNYYRLSGYCYTFRNSDDTFHPGTTFDLVWKTYAFDRRLRLLVMDALERIEVAVGSLLAYSHSHEYGAFGYAQDPSALPNLSANERADFLKRVSEQTSRSRDTFVGHFQHTYGDVHHHLPIWMAVEVMSFSTILKLFTGSHNKIKERVASKFGIPHVVLESWLLALSTVRNICAHHGRLWNREIGTRPKIPRSRRYPDWHDPVEINNRRTFAILTICRHCMKQVAPQSGWMERFEAILEAFPTIPQENMGFPDNWRSSSIWQQEDTDRQGS